MTEREIRLCIAGLIRLARDNRAQARKAYSDFTRGMCYGTASGYMVSARAMRRQLLHVADSEAHERAIFMTVS